MYLTIDTVIFGARLFRQRKARAAVDGRHLKRVYIRTKRALSEWVSKEG